MVARYPALLASRSGAAKLHKLIDFFAQEGIAPKDIPKILDKTPQILGLSVDKRLVLTLDYLKKVLKLSQQQTCALIVRAPGLLGLHPKRTLEPKISFLIDDVGLNPDAVKKVLMQAPGLLQLSPTKLARNLDFLVNVVGIPSSRLPRVIEKAPSLLCLSTESNMLPIVEFLRNEDALGIDAERVGVMIAAQPQVYV